MAAICFKKLSARVLLFKLSVHLNHLSNLLTQIPLSQFLILEIWGEVWGKRSGERLRICIFNKFPGDAEAAVWGTGFENHASCSSLGKGPLPAAGLASKAAILHLAAEGTCERFHTSVHTLDQLHSDLAVGPRPSTFFFLRLLRWFQSAFKVKKYYFPWT